MKRSLLVISVLAVSISFGMADDTKVKAKNDSKLVTGTGVCTKCELGETAKCSNAVQVKGEDGKTTTYYIADGELSKKFHKTVCQGPAKGIGVTGAVQEEGGKLTITPTAIGKLQTLSGTGLCTKCALGETKKCSNALQVKGKDGKITTYYITHDAISKAYHKNVCGGPAPTQATGLVSQDKKKQIITVSKISKKS